jgi:hypothetical protein
MSEQDVTLYIHIGMGKTGTSSIQNFLAGNHKVLWNLCSCLYPNMTSNKYIRSGFINHLKLFSMPDKNHLLSKISEAIKFCKKHSRKKLVFSAEGLFESREGPALAKELSTIPGIDLRIIVYLRRQDSWLESAWKQWGYKSQQFSGINDYIQKRDCNWYGRLQLWEREVGRERIIVRCYEKEQLPDGLIPDFLKVIGIDYTAHRWVDRKDLFKGFQRDVMEILFLNKDFCTGIADNRLQSFFEKNLDEAFQKESFKSYSFLSPDERIFILNKYEPSNQNIAREYLNRVEGTLFYESWPDPNEAWEPHNGLTIEKMVPIFTRVLYKTDDQTDESHLPKVHEHTWR